MSTRKGNGRVGKVRESSASTRSRSRSPRRRDSRGSNGRTSSRDGLGSSGRFQGLQEGRDGRRGSVDGQGSGREQPSGFGMGKRKERTKTQAGEGQRWAGGLQNKQARDIFKSGGRLVKIEGLPAKHARNVHEEPNPTLILICLLCVSSVHPSQDVKVLNDLLHVYGGYICTQR